MLTCSSKRFACSLYKPLALKWRSILTTESFSVCNSDHNSENQATWLLILHDGVILDYQPQISFNICTLHETIRHNRCADHMGILLKGSLENGDKNFWPTCKVKFFQNTILYAVLFRCDKQSPVLWSLKFAFFQDITYANTFVSCQRATAKMLISS